LKQEWKLYVKSKSSAEKIVEKMKASKHEVAAMFKEKLSIALLKQISPKRIHTDVESLVPNA
jgi:hypothetical protein